MKNKKAFTLIELMVAIAIVGILAAVVLVSMSSYAKKARASKALAQASSAIPSMVSCWGNGSATEVNNPSYTGGDICKLSSSYGKWSPMGAGTDLTSYNYYLPGGGVDYKQNKWAFGLWSSQDDASICCNSTMNGCKPDKFSAWLSCSSTSR